METFESPLNISRSIALAHLYTRESVLIQKVKLMDEHLQRLQSIVDEVADETEDWDHESLVKELEVMNEDNSNKCLQYKKGVMRFKDAIEEPQLEYGDTEGKVEGREEEMDPADPPQDHDQD